MILDLLDHVEVGYRDLNGQGDMQGDIAEHFLSVLIPSFMVISRARSTKNEPLALGPEVGLHGGVPLLPVGASEDGVTDRFSSFLSNLRLDYILSYCM